MYHYMTCYELKVSNGDKRVVKDRKLNDNFKKEEQMTIHGGKVLDYIDMTIDYRKRGKVTI